MFSRTATCDSGRVYRGGAGLYFCTSYTIAIQAGGLKQRRGPRRKNITRHVWMNRIDCDCLLSRYATMLRTLKRCWVGCRNNWTELRWYNCWQVMATNNTIDMPKSYPAQWENIAIKRTIDTVNTEKKLLLFLVSVFALHLS